MTATSVETRNAVLRDRATAITIRRRLALRSLHERLSGPFYLQEHLENGVCSCSAIGRLLRSARRYIEATEHLDSDYWSEKEWVIYDSARAELENEAKVLDKAGVASYD